MKGSSVFHLAVLLAATFAGRTAIAQQDKFVPAPHKPVPVLVKQQQAWHKPAVQRSAVAGPWTIDTNFRSSLHLKNNLTTQGITVQPILHLGNSVKYNLPSIALVPSGVAVVDINSALSQLGIAPWSNLSGYLEVQYQWPWDILCATLRNIDPLHSRGIA